MLFSSPLFLLYFLPFFLLGYRLLPSRFRNSYILLASLLFYAWGAPQFIFLLLVTSFADFHLVRLMAKQEDPKRRKYLLTGSLVLNLSLLAVFKYANFFAGNFELLFGESGWKTIVLPLGVSFFLFETITYVVDVYRREQEPLDRFFDYLLYILFFPKLLAGPIVRYGEIAGQLRDRSAAETADNFISGFFRFGLGLGKKLLIADVLGHFVNQYFSGDPLTYGWLTGWTLLFAYTFQIYFDFSGYTDMALGLAQMIGFRLPENFNNPFVARSITEFWRRWHISLGNWFRNYLYIPLGGNRSGKNRQLLNLGIVFILCGFWHGAAWNFVFWGALHGIFLLAERLALLRFLEKLPRAFGMIYVFLVISFTFVFFRSGFSLANDFRFVKSLFGAGGTEQYFPRDNEFLITLLLAAVFSWFASVRPLHRLQEKIFSTSSSASWQIGFTLAGLLLFVLSLSYASWAPFNPFVYFRF